MSESTFVNILHQLFDSPCRFDSVFFFLGYWCKPINHRKLLIVLPSDLGYLYLYLLMYFCLIYFSSVPYMARRYLNKNVFCEYASLFFF